MTIRLLTVSTLFPSAQMPSHGIFVETRLRHLVAEEPVSSIVLAPVPWFPSGHPRFGAWGRFARAPHREIRFGIEVHHPRYPAIPWIGQRLVPAAIAAALHAGYRRIEREAGRPDLIDAHYLFPDGVAAARLARATGLPLVLTARGSDVTHWPNLPWARALIRDALGRADALVTVSEALRQGLIALGVEPSKVTTLRNGVDTTLFTPTDPAAARAALGQSRPYILSVGHLIERKGHNRVIDAFAMLAESRLAGFDLIVIGDGPERERLHRQAQHLGLGARVRFPGAMPQQRLPLFYSGAATLVLASDREGWANVLLEAMACGTPAVASPAAGNEEVIRAAEAGLVATGFDPTALATAIDRMLADPPTPALTVAYARSHGWREISAGQHALFRAVLAQRAGA